MLHRVTLAILNPPLLGVYGSMTAPGKLISLSIQNLHRRLKYALAKAKVEWRIGEGRFLSQRRFRAEVLAGFESPHLYVITTTRNKQLLKKESADNSQKGDDNHIQSRVHHFETPHAHGFTP